MGKVLHNPVKQTLRRLAVVALVTLSLLQLTACGRKPRDVETPPGSVHYSYPPLDGK